MKKRFCMAAYPLHSLANTEEVASNNAVILMKYFMVIDVGWFQNDAALVISQEQYPEYPSLNAPASSCFD